MKQTESLIWQIRNMSIKQKIHQHIIKPILMADKEVEIMSQH